MKAFGLARSRVLVGFSLIGCTGLDPERFGPDGRARSLGGQAGYAFDAGLGGDAPNMGAGGSGAGAAGRAVAVGGRGGLAGASGAGDPLAGGEGGAEELGQGGAPVEPAPSGGRAASPQGGGSAGQTPRGGAAGAPGGGTSGRGGHPGLGGNAGAGGFAGSGGAGDAGKSGVGGSDGGTAGGVAEPAVHAFFFSEYVEGSASYKALELTAELASTLDGCQLVTYSNGSATGGSIALAGAVAAGSVYTLCSATLADLLGAVCDRATNLSFNGDDAVALACGGVTLDVIGQIGLDPGTAWLGPSGSTLNATLRRRCDHLAPEPDGTDPFDPDVVFTPLAVDTFDGLGDPACG
jgi:hypothetical protein